MKGFQICLFLLLEQYKGFKLILNGVELPRMKQDSYFENIPEISSIISVISVHNSLLEKVDSFDIMNV